MDQELVSVRFLFRNNNNNNNNNSSSKTQAMADDDNISIPLLVMRADGVLRLLLNSKLYKGLNPTVEGKTVLMTLPNVGEKEMAIICLRVRLSLLIFFFLISATAKTETISRINRCQMQKSQKSSQTIFTNISPSIAPTHQSHRNPTSD